MDRGCFNLCFVCYYCLSKINEYHNVQSSTLSPCLIHRTHACTHAHKHTHIPTHTLNQIAWERGIHSPKRPCQDKDKMPKKTCGRRYPLPLSSCCCHRGIASSTSKKKWKVYNFWDWRLSWMTNAQPHLPLCSPSDTQRRRFARKSACSDKCWWTKRVSLPEWGHIRSKCKYIYFQKPFLLKYVATVQLGIRQKSMETTTLVSEETFHKN